MNTKTVNSASKSVPPLYLGIWSLRHLIKQQPTETIELIQRWGFSTVEVAVFLDWTAIELHDELEKRKLKVCSLAGPPLDPNHESEYYVDWAQEYLKIFRTGNLVLQFPSNSLLEHSEEIRKKTYNDIAALLIKIARDLGKGNKDFKVSYHCYPHDFELLNGESFVSRLFAYDDRLDNLGLQLDTYWLNYGQIDPDAYASLPVHSVHLNERDENGHCCVLGTYEEKCGKYIRPLIDREEPIDWILENDPSDEKARSHDKLMTETFKKCFAKWPEFYASTRPTSLKPSCLGDSININPNNTNVILSASETYRREIGKALTEFLFGEEGHLNPLDFNDPKVEYYVLERKTSSGKDTPKYDAEKQLFKKFWPPLNDPQVLHLIGGQGSGKSTFIRYFFQYFLPHYETLLHSIGNTAELSQIYATCFQRHILLYADLRNSPVTGFRPHVFKKLAESLHYTAKRLGFANTFEGEFEYTQDRVMHNISQLAKETENGDRKWYISWVFDNSDQLEMHQLLELIHIVYNQMPQKQPSTPPTKPVQDRQRRELWRVIIPIRPETWTNLQYKCEPFPNRDSLDLDPIRHDILIEKRADFIFETVNQSMRHYQQDPNLITKERADWKLGTPKEMAEVLKEDMLDARLVRADMKLTSRGARKLLDQLVGDSARRRLNLCRQIAFSRSFATRKARGLSEEWTLLVTPFYFFDGLICGNDNVFDPRKCPILNLYNLGTTQTSWVPYSVFVGLHAIDLLNQGKQWKDVESDLAKIGYPSNDLNECKQWLVNRELIKKLWQDREYQMEPSIVSGHWALLRERAYTDNMAVACARSWGVSEEAPETDPLDPKQLQRRFRGSLWFLKRIWDVEKELTVYSPGACPDFKTIGEFNTFRKSLALSCVTNYVAKEYHFRIKGLWAYEEADKAIKAEKEQWQRNLQELKRIVEESGSEHALDARQSQS